MKFVIKMFSTDSDFGNFSHLFHFRYQYTPNKNGWSLTLPTHLDSLIYVSIIDTQGVPLTPMLIYSRHYLTFPLDRGGLMLIYCKSNIIWEEPWCRCEARFWLDPNYAKTLRIDSIIKVLMIINKISAVVERSVAGSRMDWGWNLRWRECALCWWVDLGVSKVKDRNMNIFAGKTLTKSMLNRTSSWGRVSTLKQNRRRLSGVKLTTGGGFEAGQKGESEFAQA